VNIVKGDLYFYTQRVDGRPFVNCMLYSLCSVLRWMGYDVPKDYGMTLREASGVPVREGKGTSTYDTKVAMKKLLPAAPMLYGALTDSDLWDLLPRAGAPARKQRGKAVIRVMARMHQLPTYLRRHVGYDWVGGHAIAVGGKRICNGEDGGERHAGHSNVQEIYWMDPMGKPSKGYDGEWAVFSSVRPSLYRNSEGAVRAAYGIKNTAV
jgi:hypothetical protein